MRHLVYILPAFIIGSLVINFLPEKNQTARKSKFTKEQRIEGAMADKLFTSSDIRTGKIPVDKLMHAIEEGQRRIQHPSPARSQRGNLTEAVWRERGPNNIGGRTRAVHVDESDPNRNRVWVGGVSGGIWLTEDISRPDPEWIKKGNYFESISIGDIAQDVNDHQIMYAGTGESYTNDFLSVGMYKSVDGGETWSALNNTKNFGAINEIYVHQNGDVYALTSAAGLYRSKDQGGAWELVLGMGFGANSNDMHDFVYHPISESFYVSNDFSLYKSTTGNLSEWTSIGGQRPGFPVNLSRVEFAICPSDPNIIFVLGALPNGQVSMNTYVSTDGGESWSARSAPGIMPGQDFTNGQAWYDLDIAVDPDNCLRLLAGGVPMMESISQATGWQFPIANQQVHVDHHLIAFDEKKPDRVYYGNDGGIWISNNAGASIQDKNTGYITTQFYCGAIHPDAGSPYLLGGTQDNNSLQISEVGLSPAEVVWGGDGMFCFIDQDEPDIQIVSSQGGNYGISRDGGESFDGGTSVNGAFVNRSAYDDRENLLYGQVYTQGFEYFRWDVDNSITQEVNIQGHFLDITAVEIDPRVSNRVYFGGESGRVIRVDNAHTGTTVAGTLIADLPVGFASVSSIYMDSLSSDDILVSIFNYGVEDNIWITQNGGDDWIGIEGDLPDLPVRWAMFDPANHERVMIATDAGIWTTDNVDGDNTHWEPSNPDNGMAFVRVDMLVMRNSDKTVLAATHGRGLLTTDVFSQPAAVIIAQPIAYEGQSIVIDGSQSVNAQEFEWSLGDNTTSDEAVFNHTYTAPGTYTIELKINGEVTIQRKIAVLPYLPAPYTPGVNNYTGDFETHPEHFAAYSVQGTEFARGVSTRPGKDGTHSGASAWVLGVSDDFYEENTRAEFYTPQYDLSVPGLYELKFWTKYAVQNRNDGFQLEYSTDGGASWTQLGNTTDPGWYNYLNQTIEDGGFPIGKSYFTNAQLNWVRYTKDISFLGGLPRVSFRYVFRSDDTEELTGLAIDDFEITKFEGELRTTVTVFEAAYINDQEVQINWTTGIEYQADRFVLERSFSGFDFDSLTSLNAKGVISTLAHNYSYVDPILRNIIYYRVKVVNDNPAIPYHLEFYTDTVVVRRTGNPEVVHSVVTNPFSDRINISFSSVIDKEVSLKLYDAAGRLVLEDVQSPNSVTVSLDNLWFPPGVYFLSIQVGDNDPKTYKLLTDGRAR